MIRNVSIDLGVYLMGQVHLNGPRVQKWASENYCKVSNGHIIEHVLVGQNRGSTVPTQV